MNARALLAAALFALSSAATAAPYAPQEFDFSGLEGIEIAARGTVESVQQVERRADAARLREVLEHAINPDTHDEVVVRLDDGRSVMLTLSGMQRFEVGERVQVLSSGRGVSAM